MEVETVSSKRGREQEAEGDDYITPNKTAKGQSWASESLPSENTFLLLDEKELLIASEPNTPNKYEMAAPIDNEKMKYGQVNLCLVHETRNCTWTTLQINDPNPKAIIPFILIACHFLAANIFVLLYMLFVFILPINLH